MHLLSEEEQQASGIANEIKACKESRTKVRKETKQARRPLPENLERIINAITPEELVGHEDEYVEVDPEAREVLVYNPGSCHVDIRRKFIPKNKPKKEECPFITAPIAPLPLAKSYADATLLAFFTVRPKCSVP